MPRTKPGVVECRQGIPCGDTCINYLYTCNKPPNSGIAVRRSVRGTQGVASSIRYVEVPFDTDEENDTDEEYEPSDIDDDEGETEWGGDLNATSNRVRVVPSHETGADAFVQRRLARLKERRKKGGGNSVQVEKQPLRIRIRVPDSMKRKRDLVDESVAARIIKRNKVPRRRLVRIGRAEALERGRKANIIDRMERRGIRTHTLYSDSDDSDYIE